jgi:hypothetical protein
MVVMGNAWLAEKKYFLLPEKVILNCENTKHYP